MESVNLTCHTDRTEIKLGGVLDVSQTRAAYQALNEALKRSLPVEVDAAQLERLDAAGLQLVTAFVQAARERHLRMQWSSVSAALQASAEFVGLVRALELPA
jgi:ABC-type transporter Mla MlaB component